MKMLKLLLVICCGLVIASCGGGGGGGTASSSVTGTPAMGAAMAGATVTIKDSTGVTKTGTTSATGSYNIDVAGLTPPYLIKVVAANGVTTLYSVGTSAGVINTHPLTDLIIRTWYEVQGTDVATAFNNTIPTTPPTATELGVIKQVVKNLVAQFLGLIGNVDSGSFDLISTPFTANSAGFDHFLDNIQVNAASGVVSINAVSGVAAVYQATVGVSGVGASSTLTSTLEEDTNNDGTFDTVVSTAANPISGITTSPYAGVWSLGHTDTASNGHCGSVSIGVPQPLLTITVDANGNFLLPDIDNTGNATGYISGTGHIAANGNVTGTLYGDTVAPYTGGTCPAGTLTGTMSNVNTGSGTYSQDGGGTWTLTRVTSFAGTWHLVHTTTSVTDTVNCGGDAATIGIPQDGGTLTINPDGSFVSLTENVAGSVTPAGVVSFHITGSGTCGPGTTGTGTGNFSSLFGTYSSSQHAGVWSLTRQ